MDNGIVPNQIRAAIIMALLAVIETGVFFFFPSGEWTIFLLLLILNGLALLFFWKRVGGDADDGDDMEAVPNDPLLLTEESTLRIAHETLPVLRRGLNEVTARKTAEIIQKIAEVPAVAITDTNKVLVFLGVGCEKHQPGDPILTEATKQVIATGKAKIVTHHRQLNCSNHSNCECPLSAAIIVPLEVKELVVGTLKLYQTRDGELPSRVIRLALGVAQLLNMQMELAELDRQSELIAQAELAALQAQINPHFFFNTLNTIIMYSRTNPKRARRLLVRLADFFRQTMKRRGHFATLREELSFVNTYLVLEKARFGPKLQVSREIEEELKDHLVPVLSIQPLVENAVRHGLSPKVEQGRLRITAHVIGDELEIRVLDDGAGIPPDKLPLVLIPGYGSGNGVGLSNVHERLKSLYGPEYGLCIQSQVGEGTVVTMRVPLRVGERAQSEVVDSQKELAVSTNQS